MFLFFYHCTWKQTKQSAQKSTTEKTTIELHAYRVSEVIRRRNGVRFVWLIGWLSDWRVEWLADRLVGWLVGWFGWLVEWVSEWMSGWLAHWLTGWLVGWFANWLLNWLECCMAKFSLLVGLADWLDLASFMALHVVLYHKQSHIICCISKIA